MVSDGAPTWEGRQKKIREPQKRNVSLVELRAQHERLKWQADVILAAIQKLQHLEAPAVEVRGPARFDRNTHQLSGYVADLSAAVGRLEFMLGPKPVSSNGNGNGH